LVTAVCALVAVVLDLHPDPADISSANAVMHIVTMERVGM
jgi:hypothetical protein